MYKLFYIHYTYTVKYFKYEYNCVDYDSYSYNDYVFISL